MPNSHSVGGVESTISKCNSHLLNLLSLLSMWKRVLPSLIPLSKTERQSYLFCSFSRFHPHPSKEKPKLKSKNTQTKSLSSSSVYPVNIPKGYKKLKRGVNEKGHAKFVKTDRWLEQKDSIFSPSAIMFSASVSVERISMRRDNRILR